MADRFLSLRKALEARAVDEEDVEPAIVVVVVERHAATGGLQQILVLVLAAENRLRVQAGFFCDVHEGDAQVSGKLRRRSSSWCCSRFRIGHALSGGSILRERYRRPRSREYLFKAEDERR